MPGRDGRQRKDATAMDEGLSRGWSAVAGQFMAIRWDVGLALVRAWARKRLIPGVSIPNLHCKGVDESPPISRAFRTCRPDVPLACEAAQTSAMFGPPFAAVIATALIHLLADEDQRAVLTRSMAALRPCGWMLFAAPDRPGVWDGRLTGRQSRSLGADADAAHVARTGIDVIRWRTDEGRNGHCEAQRPLR